MVVWTDAMAKDSVQSFFSFDCYKQALSRRSQQMFSLKVGSGWLRKLFLLVLAIIQLSLATGEYRTVTVNNKYILTDFELTVSEQQKIKISTEELVVTRASNTEILFIHQIGNVRSELLEDQLILLKENNYLSQINYLYDVQQDVLDIQIRLVLQQYLPEIFFKYIKFKKNLDYSSALYYAGVSPDVVYELVNKYGDNLIEENKKMLSKYTGIKEFPLLYLDGNIIEEHDLVKIIEILNHRSYQVMEKWEDLKIFVSPETELEYLSVSSDNIVRLTKEESLKIAEQLGVNILPYAFVAAQPQQVAFLSARGFVKKTNYFVKEGLGKIKFYKNRVLLPERIDVFIDGSQRESLLMLDDLAKLPQRGNIFLHTQGVASENIRLLCLYRHSPQDFWRYVNAKLFSEQDWQEICANLEIDSEPIGRCVASEEGERYLKEGLFLINELKIEHTPQILWQNQYLIGSVTDLKKYFTEGSE